MQTTGTFPALNSALTDKRRRPKNKIVKPVTPTSPRPTSPFSSLNALVGKALKGRGEV